MYNLLLKISRSTKNVRLNCPYKRLRYPRPIILNREFLWNEPALKKSYLLCSSDCITKLQEMMDQNVINPHLLIEINRFSACLRHDFHTDSEVFGVPAHRSGRHISVDFGIFPVLSGGKQPSLGTRPGDERRKYYYHLIDRKHHIKSMTHAREIRETASVRPEDEVQSGKD